ncbi:glycosyltransferase [Spirosoma litoris]
MKTQLSIIIPVFNVEKYVFKCLESIFSQKISSEEYEVIIVNDGTPDNSMSVVHEFELKYNNLKIINQKNQGLSISRNNGILNAKGKYIWFIDSDDYIKEDCLKEIIKLIEDERYEVLSTSLLWVQDDKVFKNDVVGETEITCYGKDYFFSERPYAPSQRFIIKKSFINETGLFFTPGIYHEDIDFGIRLLLLANNIYITNKSYYYYVQRQGSIMSSWKIKNSNDTLYIYEKMLDIGTQSLNSKEEKLLFESKLLAVLNFSILVAKNFWHSQEFIEFYKSNKNIIRAKAFSTFCKPVPLKYKVKSFLMFLSPKYYVSLKKTI